MTTMTEVKPEWICKGSDPYGPYAEFKLGCVIQRMRWLNPGDFFMGSPVTEAGREKIETRHKVTLTRGFWLGETACTQLLWLQATGHNPAKFKNNNKPVEQVSWNDTVGIIEQLNQQNPAMKLRLPSEAEWEYACRAGTQTPFSFGENIAPEQVNYNGNYPYTGKPGLFRNHTVEVKTLPPNPAGLYEMHGNTWEWCQDYYQEDLGGDPVIDPKGPDHGEFRLMRGACWYDQAARTRSASRNTGRQFLRIPFLSFRFARNDEPFQ
jgi:formylglycine-generating enzyme